MTIIVTCEDYRYDACQSLLPVRISDRMDIVKGEDVTGENYSYVECLPLSPVKATGCVCCLICSQQLSFVPFCVFFFPL